MAERAEPIKMCMGCMGWTQDLLDRLMVASKANDIIEIEKIKKERRQNLKSHVH